MRLCSRPIHDITGDCAIYKCLAADVVSLELEQRFDLATAIHLLHCLEGGTEIGLWTASALRSGALNMPTLGCQKRSQQRRVSRAPH
jgi:hypothetical protein